MHGPEQKLRIGGLLVSHCKNLKWSYEFDAQYKLMVFSENHNCQIALGSCRIQDGKKRTQGDINQ